MSVPATEPARHHLYQELERVIDKKAVDTFMSLVPPSGVTWENLATRRDIDRIEARIDKLDDRIVSQTRTFILANASMIITLGAIFLGAIKLR